MWRWKKAVVGGAMIAVGLGWCMTSTAEESHDDRGERAESVEALADYVEVSEGAVRIPRPTGWEVVEPGEDAVATFRSATDERAQIEVRVSDSVSPGRWERYWRAFDTNLRHAGFEVYRPRIRRSYGNRRGFVFEYILTQGDSEEFRLQVWHTHQGDRAWIFVGFYPENRRDVFGVDFSAMLEEIEW